MTVIQLLMRPGIMVLTFLIAIPASGGLEQRVAAAGAVIVAAEPTERRIEISGPSLRLRCAGNREATTPIVILEAGAFDDVNTWSEIIAPVAKFTRVCAHDRPGRGQSGPPPPGLTAQGYIALLRGALAKAGEPPPYVLVGHSLGGLIGQLYTKLHASDVAALVLVDSSHPEQLTRLAAVIPGRTPNPLPPGVSPEAVSLADFAAAVRNHPPAIAVPTIVISRSRWATPATATIDAPRLQVWMDLQRDLVKRSSNGRHIVATDSGHYIQRDEPQLVIDAIRGLARPL